MHQSRPSKIDVWFISNVADLDIGFQPGLLAKLLRSSPHRRHVVAAIIAIRFPDRRNGYPPEASEMAAELAAGRLATLLQKWLPSSPRGFLGALGRVQDGIEKPDFYRNLFRVYCDPNQSDIVRALRHVRDIDAGKLSIAIGAPAILLRTGGWQLVDSQRQRDDLVAAIAVMKSITGAADRDIERSLAAALTHGSVMRFIRNWLGRSRLPTPPDINHPMISPILSAQQLHRAAKEFENCLAGFLLDTLCGKEAFYIAASPVHGRMVVRIGHEDVEAPWQVIGVHLKRNRTPSYAATEWVEGVFSDAGIKRQRLRRDRGVKWEPIERLLDPVGYDLDELADWLP